MRKKNLIIISLWIISALCWAFLFALRFTDRTVFVYTCNLESTPGVRVLDANNPFFKITRAEPNRVEVDWGNTGIHLKGHCRVKMREGTTNTQVLGTLREGKTYPVVIDSGFCQYLSVSDTIVLDAGLDIYPAKELGSDTGGFCHLCRLKIGDLTIVHSPCTYTLAHYEKRGFGRDPWKEKKILFGLRLMKKFRYILIDNINQEVEFSVEELFEPADPNRWSRFPASLESDNTGGERLMVDIPIADQTRHLMFDTGADSGLIVAKDVWETIAAKLTIVRKTRNKLSMMHGFEPCDEITVEKLVVGDSSLSNEKVQVLDNDNPWGNEFLLLGMDYFKDTVVVIDFEHNLLWIHKPQSLQLDVGSMAAHSNSCSNSSNFRSSL